MFGKTRRSSTAPEEVLFCDSCAEVSTPAQRTQRRYEQARTTVYTLISPR
ncbi:hypothetical protein ACWENR_06460 [Micromonospora sp. NPDC004336]